MKPHAKTALSLALAIVGGIAAGMRCDASEWVENSSQTNPRPAAYTVKAYTEGSDPFIPISQLRGCIQLCVPNQLKSVFMGLESDKCYVFSAQNVVGKRFDVHCRYMTAKDVDFRDNGALTNYAGLCIITNVSYMSATWKKCYNGGLILNVAEEINELYQPEHFNVYFLKFNGADINVESFAHLMNKNMVLPGSVVESVLLSSDLERPELVEILVGTKNIVANSDLPKWTVTMIDFNLKTLAIISKKKSFAYFARRFAGINMGFIPL